jgi:hypothetical protein
MLRNITVQRKGQQLVKGPPCAQKLDVVVDTYKSAYDCNVQ